MGVSLVVHDVDRSQSPLGSNPANRPRTDDAEDQFGAAHRLDPDYTRSRGSRVDQWTARVSAWIAMASGPRAGSGSRRLAWASWIVAVASAVYIGWAIRSGPALIAVALPFLLLRFPVAGIVSVAILAEEINPNGVYGAVTTLGSQVFFAGGKAPVILPLAATAALAACARWWRPRDVRVTRVDAMLFVSALGLVGLTIIVGLFYGQAFPSTVNQNARPFVLLVLGVIVGVTLRRLPEERKRLVAAAGAALTVLLILAAIAAPLGVAADARVSRYFIYYDSALPTVAAAVFIAMLGDGRWRWDWRHMVVVAGTPLLVLVSFRRSVWIAAAIVLVLSVVLVWARWRKVLVRLGFAGVIAAMVVFAAPGFAADLGLRSAATFPVEQSPAVTNAGPDAQGAGPAGTSQTTTHSPTTESAAQQAESTNGHVHDLREGWTYVRANFWSGIGPLAPQLPGLAAATASRVYVHNEYLQDWLRYGPFAVLLVVVLLVAAALLALRALRDPDSDVVDRSAALFCLMVPLCLMTAPFLSDTSRWPLLIGVSAGILALRTPGSQAGTGRLPADGR